jgi:hypothetical protein
MDGWMNEQWKGQTNEERNGWWWWWWWWYINLYFKCFHSSFPLTCLNYSVSLYYARHSTSMQLADSELCSYAGLCCFWMHMRCISVCVCVCVWMNVHVCIQILVCEGKNRCYTTSGFMFSFFKRKESRFMRSLCCCVCVRLRMPLKLCVLLISY